MASLKAVTDADFDHEVLDNSSPVLVDFWAEWCGPCKALAPTLDAVAEQYDGVVEVAKLDIDTNTATRDRFGVRGIPTLALFAQGREIARLTGVQSRSKLTSFLDQHLDRTPAPEQNPLSGFGSKGTFDGEEARKRQCIDRLSAGLDAQILHLGMTMWDGTVGSALAVATKQIDAEGCASVLGVPPSVISLVDILSTYFGTTAKGGQFVLEWLEMLPVAVDATPLARTAMSFLLNNAAFTKTLTNETVIEQLRDRVLARHALVGAEVDVTGWADLRAEIGQHIGEADERRAAALRCLQDASWSVYLSDTLQQTLMSIAMTALRGARDYAFLSKEEETEALRLMNEELRRLEKSGEVCGPTPGVRKQYPDLMARFEQSAHRTQSAMRNVGQAVADHLLQQSRALAG